MECLLTRAISNSAYGIDYSELSQRLFLNAFQRRYKKAISIRTKLITNSKILSQNVNNFTPQIMSREPFAFFGAPVCVQSE